MAFKFCPECGYKLDGQYKFCPECGYKLLATSTPTAENVSAIKVEKQSAIHVEKVSAARKSRLSDGVVGGVDFSQLEKAFDKQVKEKESAEKNYQTTLTRAKMLSAQEKFTEARKLYESILEQDPEDINARIGEFRVISFNYERDYETIVDKDVKFLTTLFTDEQIKAADKDCYNYIVGYRKYLVKKEEENERKRQLEIERRKQAEKEKLIAQIGYKREGDYVYYGSFPQEVENCKNKNMKYLLDFKVNDRTYGILEDQATKEKYIGERNVYESDIRYYGNYTCYRRAPIKWRILEEKDGILTLLCDRIIYTSHFADVQTVYSNSFVRKELKRFLDYAFNSKQKSFLLTEHLKCEDQKFGFNTLYDNIWLLSQEECKKYYDKIKYDVSKKLKVFRVNGFRRMMLRDCHNFNGESCYLVFDNNGKYYGIHMYDDNFVIPVIKINAKLIEETIR